MGKTGESHVRLRLIIMNILQWAAWGAYLTSMGSFLAKSGFADKIGLTYSVQGFVSIFMPAAMGIVADRFIAPQRTMGLCHLITGLCLVSAGTYAVHCGTGMSFPVWFTLYATGCAFFMPTISISYGVAYKILEDNGFDNIKTYPSIRVFGTIGFILSMLAVNFIHNGEGVAFQFTGNQFIFSGAISLCVFLYSFTLPNCVVDYKGKNETFVERLGLNAFRLFKDRDLAVFFIFSALLGVAMQITNGFANPYISSFMDNPQYADSWGARNANALISLSQISETLCILLIPIVFKKLGIKKVLLISMVAWFLRFALLGLGNPGAGIWMFVLSCIVYGIAFDFFNISGSLYVNERTAKGMRHSAQGLFMLMTNGFGATFGTLGAQLVVNRFVINAEEPSWPTAWMIFAFYALALALAFTFAFGGRERKIFHWKSHH